MEKLLFKKNHYHQLLYLLIIIIIEYLLIRDVFPLLPRNSIILYHGSLVIALTSFICTSLSNPGEITSTNVSFYMKKYPYDNILFSKRECPTCLINKPARSHHCGICNKCVPKYEHHCLWVNNCIGERNCRWFILFLILTSFVCFHCTLLCSQVVSFVVEENKLWDQTNVHYSNREMLEVLFSKTGTALFVGLFLLATGTMLFVFALYHIIVVGNGMTINEKFQWQRVVLGGGKKKNRYDKGLLKNFIAFFSPTTQQPQHVRLKKK
ncbi:Palmitoyltransferase [Entamoeba marina]